MNVRPYRAEDGIEMLSRLPNGLAGENEKSCREAEQEGMAFTIIYEGKMVACVGVVKERKGIGLAWALYPLDIGNYHIDPRLAKDGLRELMERHGLWRVAATARADFPAAHSYLRYLGFKREGRMEKAEPDKTDSILYAITR